MESADASITNRQRGDAIFPFVYMNAFQLALFCSDSEIDARGGSVRREQSIFSSLLIEV